jgi:membrane protease YdiL (CAAX protease family)
VTATAAVSVPAHRERTSIAPLWHTVFMVGIFAWAAASGWYVQRAARVDPNYAGLHAPPLAIYSYLIVFEWVTVALVWIGVRRRGVRVRDLVAGRWESGRDFATDAALGVAVWAIWIGILKFARLMFGPESAAQVLPQPSRIIEIALWIGVSISAGFCEEVVFRGYFQRQFQTLTGNEVIGVLLQALVFSLGHSYEGTMSVVTITALALLFGFLAMWRQSLRAAMLGHAWTDVAAGLFSIG